MCVDFLLSLSSFFSLSSFSFFFLLLLSLFLLFCSGDALAEHQKFAVLWRVPRRLARPASRARATAISLSSLDRHFVVPRRRAPRGRGSVPPRLFERMRARADFGNPAGVLVKPRAAIFWGFRGVPPARRASQKNRRRRLFRIFGGGGGRPSPGQRPPSPGRRTAFGPHPSMCSKILTRSR